MKLSDELRAIKERLDEQTPKPLRLTDFLIAFFVVQKVNAQMKKFRITIVKIDIAAIILAIAVLLSLFFR